MTRPRPRLCLLEKGSDGYGFHLHGEKGKSGQFIRLVEPDSTAEASGLRAGDRLVFVNGECVEGDSHQQVVSRIRATVGKLELIVVDQETEDVLKEHNLKCMKEYVTEGIPIPSDAAANDGGVEEGDIAAEPAPTPAPEENGGVLLEKKLSISSDKVTPIGGCLFTHLSLLLNGLNINHVVYVYGVLHLRPKLWKHLQFLEIEQFSSSADPFTYLIVQYMIFVNIL